MEPKHLQFINLMKNCTSCGLATGRSQVVVGDYGPRNGICFVGEAPGRNEDIQGRPFVGQSGKLLDNMLEAIGLGRKSVSVLNIAKCRPPNNRNPTTEESKICGSLWLNKQLEYLDPIFIVTLGGVSLKYFAPNKKPTGSKGKLLNTEKYKIYPMLHPAYVLYGGITRDQYLQDFKDMYQIYLSNKNTSILSESLKDESSPKQTSLDDFI